MADNEKGELIKNTDKKIEQETIATPTKKIVVVKKKKVVLKKTSVTKQDSQENEIEEESLDTKEISADTSSETNENINSTNSSNDSDSLSKNSNDGTTTPKKIIQYKNKNNSDTKEPLKSNPAKTFIKRVNLNNSSTTGQAKTGGSFMFNKASSGSKPGFTNNSGPGGIKRKIGGSSAPPSTTPAPINNDKDRLRKKISNKKYDQDKTQRYDSQGEMNKAFMKKKKKDKIQNEAVIPESIDIIDIISISDLAKKMNIKSSKIISKLLELGTMVTINDKIDSDTASIVASEFNCRVNVVSLYDETVIQEEEVNENDFQQRPPIVTVMGHVDHGKTMLLDAIRSTNIAAGETGGITQHIGAYSVELKDGKKVTFIDTPGHEAFSMMRARGAEVTDIVILVVAADDGVMPQTVEAIKHAKEAKVPIVVAINKIDKHGVNLDKIKQELSIHELLPEEWGGQTLYAPVSALKKIGIEDLLATVTLQAEMLDLKVPYNVRASGFVLEAKIDQGRGVVATILILKGTLKIGDFFVAGVYSGKIRTIYNDRGEKIQVATPSMAIEITGLENIPKAGDPFNVTASEKEAKNIASKRQELSKMEEAKLVKKIGLEDILSQKRENEVQEVRVMIKADVQGSAEAVKDSLVKLSNAEIKIVPVQVGVGAINESDVMTAVASKSIIIGFRVRPNPKASLLAEKEKIEVRRYNIIFDVVDDIKGIMEGMIKPDLQEQMIGTVEVKQIFKISKVGNIAGSIVTSGKVKRNSLIRVIRDDVVIHEGKIATLRRFKDEVSEVNEGTECGIWIENYKNIKEGDTLEAYEIKEITRTLEDIEAKAKEEIKAKEKEKKEKESKEQS